MAWDRVFMTQGNSPESAAGRGNPEAGAEPDAAGAGAQSAKDRKGGRPDSLEDLYRKYAPSLYWVCMRYVKNKEDAEDMVNQVFLKVRGGLASFKGDSGVYTWMYRIAVNECIQLFRKRKFEIDGACLDSLEERMPQHPERQLDARLTLERMFAGTDSETAEILFLLYFEGFTQEEVVEKMGISRTTVHRKVAAFKARMEAYR